MLLSLWLTQNPDCRELLDSLKSSEEVGTNIFYLTVTSSRFPSLDRLLGLRYGADGDCDYLSLLSVIGEELYSPDEKSVYLWVNPLLLLAHEKLIALEEHDVALCAFSE